MQEDMYLRNLAGVFQAISERKGEKIEVVLKMVIRVREICGLRSYKDAAIFIFNSSWHPGCGWRPIDADGKPIKQN